MSNVSYMVIRFTEPSRLAYCFCGEPAIIGCFEGPLQPHCVCKAHYEESYWKGLEKAIEEAETD